MLRIPHYLSVALVICTWQSVSSAQQEEKVAFVRPPADLTEFSLQGEYAGSVSGDDGEKVLAIQVRSLGNDEYDGLLFRGGLPGQDGHEDDSTRIVGSRLGSRLVLSGSDKAIFVDSESDECRVISIDGERLGTLSRVRRQSPTLGAGPPEDAMVLFDGESGQHFSGAEITDAGLLKVGADLIPLFQDFDLHLEFKLPYMPGSDSQARGNSGIYLHSRYECQILDSFAQRPVFNGCGAIYRFKKPDVNMCLPPLTWQTYDIRFTAPRWNADGTKRRNARISSWLNGVKVQDNVDVPNKTGHGKPEGPELLPTKFQNHSDPVRFRNVWIIDRGLSVVNDFPPLQTEG